MSIGFLIHLPDLEELTLVGLNLTSLDISNANNKLKVLSLKRCEKLNKLTGLENCTLLEELDVRTTALEELVIPNNMKGLKKLAIGQEWKLENTESQFPEQLKKSNIICTNIKMRVIPSEIENFNDRTTQFCSQLTKIRQFQNTILLEGLNPKIQEIVCFHDLFQRRQSQFFISIPATQIILYNAEQCFANSFALQQNETDVKQLLLIQQNCLELNYQNQYNQLLPQVINDKLTLSSLKLVHCTNIDSIASSLCQFQQLIFKFCNIGDLSFFQSQCEVKQLTIKNCQNLANFENIDYCQNLQDLILRNCAIKNFNFFDKCPNLLSICVNYCQQLCDISQVSTCSQLQQLEIIQSKVQDFSPIHGLYNIRKAKIASNYRQQRDIQLNIIENEAQQFIVRKQNLFIKQIKQTYYYIEKCSPVLVKDLLNFQQGYKQRILFESKLCLDIINTMLHIIS